MGFDVELSIHMYRAVFFFGGGEFLQCCVGCFSDITKGSLSYLSSPCFSKNVLQSGVGIVH